MCGTLIFGIFFILFGMSLIFNIFFGINIPIFKIFFAFFFIYLGIKIIIGFPTFNFCTHVTHKETTFHGQTINEEFSSKKDSYNYVFGSGVLDLSNIKIENNKPLNIDVNVVFGNGTIKLNPNIPTKIKLTGAFSSTELPDKTSIALGSHTYFTHPTEQEPQINIHANVVFGKLLVISEKN